MQRPDRDIKEKCPYCGLIISVRWFDPCCDKQHSLYKKELAEWIKWIKETNPNTELKYQVFSQPFRWERSKK